MSKIKTTPIQSEWKEVWLWFQENFIPRERKIIWIVTYWTLRPVEDDILDPLITEPVQMLFNWAGEIATTDRIYDYGLRLLAFSDRNVQDEAKYTFITPDQQKEYIGKRFISVKLPEFHIRLIDTKVLEEWFLVDFVPRLEWTKENPWINYDDLQTLYRWGIYGLRGHNLATLITSLMIKFYQNTLTNEDINLINEKANEARIVTSPNMLIWKDVAARDGYLGPTTPGSKKKDKFFLLNPSPLTLKYIQKLKKLKIGPETRAWLQEEVDYTIVRDCETLLFLELKDLVDVYINRRCKNAECQRPLPVLINKKRYHGPYCPPTVPGYIDWKSKGSHYYRKEGLEMLLKGDGDRGWKTPLALEEARKVIDVLFSKSRSSYYGTLVEYLDWEGDLADDMGDYQDRQERSNQIAWWNENKD